MRDGASTENRSDRDAAIARAAELADEHAEAEALAADAEVRRDTLESTLGAEVAELEARLEAVADARTRLEALLETADRARVDLIGRAADLEARVETGTDRLAAEDRTRAEAIDELVRFEAEGLLRVGVPDLPEPPPEAPWGAEAAVRFARRIEQQLTSVADDDAAWERHQRNLHHHFTSLASALGRHGHEATAEQSGDLMLVRILFQARRSDPAELAVVGRRDPGAPLAARPEGAGAARDLPDRRGRQSPAGAGDGRGTPGPHHQRRARAAAHQHRDEAAIALASAGGRRADRRRHGPGRLPASAGAAPPADLRRLVRAGPGGRRRVPPEPHPGDASPRRGRLHARGPRAGPGLSPLASLSRRALAAGALAPGLRARLRWRARAGDHPAAVRRHREPLRQRSGRCAAAGDAGRGLRRHRRRCPVQVHGPARAVRPGRA
ncbi:MAG: hypothetical protein U5R48_16770 [Gammaproteobacteria bacterium]|nr:hypothetical protein [Gammaproteobacteria bacterium]